jgi:hypothetical protein
MARCFGITKKLTRCRLDRGTGWFCHLHGAQPRYFLFFIFSSIFSIFFSWVAGILPVPGCAQRNAHLTPGDFSISLHVTAHANALRIGYQEPQRVAMLASIGPVRLESAMEVQPEPAREYPSTRNPTRHWKYFDKAPFVSGLSKLTIRDLVGKKLTARVPVRAFKFEAESVIFQFRVFVRGREIYAETDKNGEVSLLLTEDLLMGS